MQILEMILFKKIRWKNFLSTGDRWTEMELDATGTTLIVGSNGAGKSTLIKVLAGVHPKTSGTISIEGKKLIFLLHAKQLMLV